MEELVNGIEAEGLSPSQLDDVYGTLAKVLGNILQHPAEAKYRTLKKDNRLVQERLAKSSNAIALLLALGFEDTGVAYCCPVAVGTELMDEAVQLLDAVQASRGELAAATPAPAAPAPPAPAAPAAPAPAPAATPAPTTPAAPTPAAEKARGAAGPPRSAFDFESRRKQEEAQQRAAGGLQDLRQLQKERFQDFKRDPNAQQTPMYQQPASTVQGSKTDEGWGGWLGGWLGGGGSSSSSGRGGGGGGGGRPERRGPNIKGIGDLPKPVQRG